MQDKMEGNKVLAVPVTLKGGGNYLLWSRLVKTVIGSKGLWGHVTDGVPKPVAIDGGSTEIVVADQEKWAQEDLKVLAVLQGSLEASILEAYSYCETPKALWETLQKVYGNISNLSRVFEVKRAINTLMQEEEEFTKHLGKFRALWSELEMLRPNTNDEATLMERREQDQVFGLLLTLNPVYKDVIKHMLRSPKLPSFDDMCAQLQKEDDSLGLFGGKGEMTSANQVETVQANKAAYKGDERKFGGNCDHCKKPGHKRSQCWILHPHLKPSKFVKDREGRAHLSAESSEAGSSRGSNGAGVRAEESDVKAMASQHTSGKSSMEHEMIRRSDIDALIKALKDNGSSLTHTLGYHMLRVVYLGVLKT